MILGETIASGASSKCPDCNRSLPLEVLKSGAGYYLGTMCCMDADTYEESGHCQPYSRETGYWATKKEAEEALTTGVFELRY